MEDEWTLVLDSTLLPRADRPASVRLHEDAITVLGRDQAHVDVLLDSAQFPALISRTHAKLELRRGARPVLVACSLRISDSFLNCSSILSTGNNKQRASSD